MTWDQNQDQNHIMADAEGSRIIDGSGEYTDWSGQGSPDYEQPQQQQWQADPSSSEQQQWQADPSSPPGRDTSVDYSGDGGTGWQDYENQTLTDAQFAAENPEAGSGIG